MTSPSDQHRYSRAALDVARENMREAHAIRERAASLPRWRWWKRRRLESRAWTIEVATGQFLGADAHEQAYLRALARKLAPHMPPK